MKSRFFRGLPFCVVLSACASTPSTEARKISSEEISWVSHKGVESAEIDGKFTVVRANPRRNPVELANPPASSGSVAEAAGRRGWLVAINAAMFAKDYVTSIGYMRNFKEVNNPKLNPKLKGFLMLNPKNPSSPAAKIGGKEEIEAYHTVFQTHRMWHPKLGILWKRGASVYHQSGLVGVDGQGRVLFFFHPELADMHDWVTRILELKLDLKGLLYLDGGSHGALHLDSALGRSVNTWISLPNLLGIKAR
jgi:hypothetical protein